MDSPAVDLHERLANFKVTEQRWLNMQRGLRLLADWLSDQVVDGLATLEEDSHTKIEHIATQLVDCSLAGPANALRKLTPLVGNIAGWELEVEAELGFWNMIRGMVQHVDRLSDDQLAGLLTTLGHRFRKTDVLAGEAIPPALWTCIGIETGEEQNLYHRKTYWRGSTAGAWGTQLAFSYGSPLPSGKTTVGTCLHAELYAYPGGLPGRIELPEQVTLSSEKLCPHHFSTWQQQQTANEQLFSERPWQRDLPLAVGPLELIYDQQLEVLQLLDGDGVAVAVPCGKTEHRAWTLYSLAAGKPAVLFGLLVAGTVLMQAVWVKEQLFALEGEVA